MPCSGLRVTYCLFAPESRSETSGDGVGDEPGPSTGKPPLRCGTPINSAADAGDSTAAGGTVLEPAFEAAPGADAAAPGAPSKGGTSRGTGAAGTADAAGDADDDTDAEAEGEAAGAGFGAT